MVTGMHLDMQELSSVEPSASIRLTEIMEDANDVTDTADATLPDHHRASLRHILRTI